MAVWHTGPAAFTARGTITQPRHLRRQSCLINDDQLRWVEIELIVELGAATSQDVRAILLQCMCGLFLNFQPCPRSQSFRGLRPVRIERSTSRRSTISFSVMPLRSSIIPTKKSRKFVEARSPPSLLRPRCRLADLGPCDPRDRTRYPDPKPDCGLPRADAII